jgi:hypothetical protein
MVAKKSPAMDVMSAGPPMRSLMCGGTATPARGSSNWKNLNAEASKNITAGDVDFSPGGRRADDQ